MPYTSPSQQRSPASSSPSLSPSAPGGSLSINENCTSSSSGHAHLPRSQSSRDYVYKHRRSPSFTNDYSLPIEKQRQINGTFSENDAASNGLIKTGGGSVEKDEIIKKKKRPNFRLENLAELEEALRLTIDSKAAMSYNEDENKQNQIADLARLALSEQVRKFSHARSSSEITLSSTAFQPPSKADSIIDSDSDDDEDLQMKPPLVRKKSGELVKPALRPSSRQRPSSVPGTPTYGKAVHFNEDIEQVRHFLQVDRPMAVSAGSSPQEKYDSESEFPFGDDDSSFRTPSWEMRTSSFPKENFERQTSPVRLERLFMSPDSKNLVGIVAVANMSYHKLVVARFTLDSWKTTSEVAAQYSDDLHTQNANDGYDRFTFTIKLADQANLEKKTLFLCVRYNVNGVDYWDNNTDTNFKVDFLKKTRASGLQNGALPRCKPAAIPRSRNAGPAPRPRSMPPLFDDEFTKSFPYNFPVRQTKTFLSAAPPPKLKFRSQNRSVTEKAEAESATGVASKGLSTRYSFGASLSAALSNAQAAMGDSDEVELKKGSDKPTFGYFGQAGSTARSSAPKPAALSADKPDLKSAEYDELIKKYCFFGSTKTERQGSAAESPSTAQVAPVTEEIDVSPKAVKVVKPEPEQPSQVDGTDDRTETRKSVGIFSPQKSHVQASSSTETSRAQSPVSFGYIYHQNMHGGGGGIFGEVQAPQAILG